MTLKKKNDDKTGKNVEVGDLVTMGRIASCHVCPFHSACSSNADDNVNDDDEDSDSDE